MVFGAWVLFLGLAAWLFQGALNRQFNPNQAPHSAMLADRVVEVTLRRNRSGHYVSAGRINGRGVEFLVDTGATDVSLSESAARRLGLPRGAPVSLVTANGLTRGFRTVIGTVAVGDIVQRDVAAVVSPGIHDDLILLGMSFLKHLDLEQKSDRLILRQHPVAGGGP